jgi:hypothetical protein
VDHLLELLTDPGYDLDALRLDPDPDLSALAAACAAVAAYRIPVPEHARRGH